MNGTLSFLASVYKATFLRPMSAKPRKGNAMTDTLNLLARRRSAPPPMMKGPGPTQDELARILELAARVPDHGKLAPWRFIVFAGESQSRAGALCAEVFHAQNPEASEERLTSERARFSRAPLVVAVVSRAAPHAKIPVWEQEMSAGAVCMNLTVAAVALGFRTAWLTEWIAYDRAFLTRLGLAEHEKIAGYIHIGRVEAEIEDRPRPDVAALTTYF
jgi:nitroreductase